MAKSIIESIREYILSCSYLDERALNVDYLNDGIAYSVDPLPCDPIIQRYVDGGKKKQYQFAFSSKDLYDADARINIENSGFYQKLEEWFEDQTDHGILPDLENPKQQSLAIETLNSGYLYDAETDLGQYRIECRLIYEQEV